MKQRMAHVWIQDHGIGIPREYLEKIFDPFVRLGVSHTIKGGSGLGLAISRQIIKMHGGQIWADSAGDGKGSIFCFALPLAADDVDDSVTERRAAIRQKAR
jgi:signal transduction histidine kinase